MKLLFTTCIILLVGFADGYAIEGDKPTSSTTALLSASIATNIPYIYEPYWKLPSLSDEQKTRLENKISKTFPSNSSPWFILVKYVDKNGGVECAPYFHPSKVNNRLWKGKSGHMGSKGLDDYYYVTSSNQTDTTINVPVWSNLPFRVDAGKINGVAEMPDEDIVAIVDTVRNDIKDHFIHEKMVEFMESQNKTNDDFYKRTVELKTSPIMSITEESDSIWVKTFLSSSPLRGRGLVVFLRKKDGGWVVIRRLKWLS